MTPFTSNLVVIYFKLKHDIYLIWSLVSPSMSCEFLLRFVSFLALVALEWSLHHVSSHVGFQITRLGGSKVALDTFERSFSCVPLHHMNFHMNFPDTRIFAYCASLWLFTRVCRLVRLQVSWFCQFGFTLNAVVQFFPGMLPLMHLQTAWMCCLIFALIAIVYFFPHYAFSYAFWGMK